MDIDELKELEKAHGDDPHVRMELDALKIAPGFLCDMYGDERLTCMHWGFECGVGWREPLLEMCRKFEELNNGPGGKVCHAAQIKQKWGDLSVYVEYDRDVDDETKKAVDGIIGDAVLACSTLCELCGQPMTHYGKGWIRPLCDNCDRGETRG